ncbi:ead/Ea22-like family protein [Klebsiella pneumoniae]|uniref:ead/Ea22-like family protein n=1 Tax=Klebsiella pneumoniae TaxID=573 RepID=UPI0040576426
MLRLCAGYLGRPAMTDITELAQNLKAAAEKATPGQWERGDGKHGGELLVYCDDALGSAVCEATSGYNAIPKYQRIDNLDFIALANPANILALVEVLKKAQAIKAAAEKLVRCKGRYHSEQNYRALAALFGVTTPDLPPLEHENVHYADAAEMEIAALRQRIAELESRLNSADKLQDSAFRSGLQHGFSLGQTDDQKGYEQSMAAYSSHAGIKVEAE